jgi:hypothetical protein
VTIASTFTKNALATEYGALATHGAVYTTAPGAAAGTEPSGGTPAYARKPLTWSAPTDGVITASAVFDVPEDTTIVGTGLHDALTGGNYIDGQIESSVTFDAQDTVTVNFSYTQV